MTSLGALMIKGLIGVFITNGVKQDVSLLEWLSRILPDILSVDAHTYYGITVVRDNPIS